MPLSVSVRQRLNRYNGTTAAGLALARAAGTRRVGGPQGTIIAERYGWPVPAATCFVIGDVLFCRHSARWLSAPEQRAVLRHEVRHTDQYARFGPLFWPLYLAACGWSYAITGTYGARNAFERGAGLADGGYSDAPLRPALRTLFSSS